MKIPNSPAAVSSVNARRIFATDDVFIGKADGQSKSEDLQNYERCFRGFALSRKESTADCCLFITYDVKKTRLTATAVFWALCTLSPCRAGEQADSVSTKVETIAEVEISARRLSREVSSTTPMQRMQRSSLTAIAARNAADAVRHFAGTNIKDYGGIGGLKTVSVRGLGATHTAVSYDDIVVGNCQAGQIDLGRFAANSLEGVTLHMGQPDNLTVTARALASGSLVSLSSRQPEWSDKPYRMEAALTGGSFGYLNPTLDYAHKLGERTYTSLSLDLSSAHGRYPYTLVNGTQVTTEERTNTDVAHLLGEWSLRHTMRDGSSLDTKLYAYASERGLPGAIILYNNTSTERLADRNIFAQMRYSKAWEHCWQLRASAKYTYGYDRYTDTNVKYEGGVQTDENLQHEYYAQATLLYSPSSAWQFSVAQDGFANTLTSNLPSCPDPIRYTSLTALQAQYRSQRVNLRGILLGTIVSEHSGRERETTIKSQLSTKNLTPTLSTSLRPFADAPLYVRMMYKHTFRMPTFNDLYYFRSGNKDLRPERAREYNLGFTWQAPTTPWLSDLMLTLDGYYNNVTDKIVAFPSTYVWKMANYGRVHITGLDVTLAATTQLSSTVTFNASLSYTLTRAIDVTDPESQGYGVQLPYTPLHSGSSRLLLTTPWGNVGYSLLLASERYSMSEQSPRYHIAGYADHTLTLSRTFTVGTTRLTAQAEALNLTNASYQIIQYYPMPGRQFRVTLRWEI